MTKIDIVSGFLGAGKTTLIKKMLSEAYQGEKLVLIENEFGEISIDGGFLKDAGVQISEMSSGCICCSLVGDFGRALVDVQKQFSPDRILIEPSGVGKLSDVILAVENTVKDVPEMKLNSFVTVADASKVKVYMKNFGEFYNNQIETAGTIILSRTQTASQDRIDKTVELLRQYNERARIVTTPWDELEPKKILDVIESPDFLLTVDELMAGFDARIQTLADFAADKTAVVGMCTSGGFNVLGNDGRCSIIGREIGFENIGVDADIDTSTHGNEASFEFLVDKDPDYLFVLDRDAAIGTDGAKLAQEVVENELMKGTAAYRDGRIVYLAHPAVWYTAEGGITALDLMLQDLESELLG